MHTSSNKVIAARENELNKWKNWMSLQHFSCLPKHFGLLLICCCSLPPCHMIATHSKEKWPESIRQLLFLIIFSKFSNSYKLFTSFTSQFRVISLIENSTVTYFTRAEIVMCIKCEFPLITKFERVCCQALSYIDAKSWAR